MTAIVETLDLVDQRGEIIRYSLNSEVFYAFSVSYLISLLKKIGEIASLQGHIVVSMPLSPTLNQNMLVQVNKDNKKYFDDDLKDLLKTIQIQLCLKQQELSIYTMKKLIIIHQTLPVLNAQFLTILLQASNKMRELRLTNQRT